MDAIGGRCKLPRTKVRGFRLVRMREELDNPVGDFGPVYGGPACGDHLCGVDVRIDDHSAGCATEGFSVPNSSLAAGRTGLARIGGIHRLEPDSLSSRLVPDERLKLSEAPKGDHPVQVTIGNSETVPNAPEILHANQRAPVSDGLFNDGLGDFMVPVRHPAPLVAGELAENSLGSPRPVALKRRPDAPAILTKFADGLAVELPAGGCHGDITDTEVHPENASSGGVRDFGLDNDIDEKTSVPSADKRSGRRLLSSERLSLVVSDVELGLDPLSRVRGEGNRFAFERERPLIERDERGANLELPLEFGRLEHSTGTTKRRYDQVRGEPEFGTDRPVKRVVETDRVGFPMIASPLGDLGNGSGVSKKKLVEDGGVVGVCGKLTADRSYLLHDSIVLCILVVSRRRRFLPP